MALPWEWRVATRYLGSARGRGLPSLITTVSVLGLALGVAVLVVVLSVMNGFERELRGRILAVAPQATISGLEGPLPDWQEARQRVQQDPRVLAAMPYVEAQAMAVHGAATAATQVRGLLPAEERRADGLAARLPPAALAALAPGSFNVVLGDALAQQLGVAEGGEVVLVAPQGTATPAGFQPAMRRFHVAGLFHSGLYEYDSALALVALGDAQRLYRLGAGVTGLRLALRDAFAAPHVVRELALRLGGGYYISDWTRLHANFFRSIATTKTIMFVLLMLLVAVASFNLVAALVMVVRGKRDAIAILRTLGALPRQVLAVFALQGVLIGLAGTLAGAAFGVLVASHLEGLVKGIERLTGVHFLDARLYFLSELPAWVEWGDVARVCAVAFALCALATLYPAWRAATTAPAQALRHE